jgi:hypothetical protein
MPRIERRQQRLPTIPGQVPNPVDLPSGCPFHPRCDLTRRLAAEAEPAETVNLTVEGEPDRVLRRTVEQRPQLLEVEPEHWVACWNVAGFESASETRPDLDHRRALPGTGTSAASA